MYNLHNHTIYSDGKLDPVELLSMAKEKNLKGIAITDHDSIDGLKYAYEFLDSNKIELDFFPGIEMSCRLGDQEFVDYIKKKTESRFPEIHIVGLNIDYKNSELIKKLDILLEKRRNAGLQMVENLRNIGLKLFPNDEHLNEKFIGRVKIALELMRIGAAISVTDAFDKYLYTGSPYYVQRINLTIKEAVNLIHAAGGITSLAHPGEICNYEVIDRILEEPLDAIECYHPENDIEMTDKMVKAAEKRNLMITGGSDFHGHKYDDYTNFTLYGVEEWRF